MIVLVLAAAGPATARAQDEFRDYHPLLELRRSAGLPAREAAERLGAQADFKALRFLLARGLTEWIKPYAYGYCGRHSSPGKVVFFDIDPALEEIIVAYYPQPALAQALRKFFEGRACRYRSRALFELMLEELRSGRFQGGAYDLTRSIIRTEQPGIEAALLEAASTLRVRRPGGAPADWVAQARGEGPRRYPMSSFKDLIRFLGQRRHAPAVPWLGEELARLGPDAEPAITVLRALIEIDTPAAADILRQRLVRLKQDGGWSAQEETRKIASMLSGLPLSARLPLALRDLLPDSGSLRFRAAFEPVAHTLIARIVGHYRSLDSYADRGERQVFSPGRPDTLYYTETYATRYRADGHYRLEMTGYNDRRRVSWGAPDCHSRYDSSSGIETCRPGSADRVFDHAVSPVPRILGAGEDVFYRSGHAYRVEAAEGEGLQRLVGFRVDSGQVCEEWLIEAASGRIRALRQRCHQPSLNRIRWQADNQVSAADLRYTAPWRARFHPFRLFRRDPAGLVSVAALALAGFALGFLPVWLRARRGPPDAEQSQARRRVYARTLKITLLVISIPAGLLTALLLAPGQGGHPPPMVFAPFVVLVWLLGVVGVVAIYAGARLALRANAPAGTDSDSRSD